MADQCAGRHAWPIAGATFILLAKEKTDSDKKMVKFFDRAFKNWHNKAKELAYIPLPKSLKDTEDYVTGRFG